MAFYLFPIGLAKIFTPSDPGYEPYGIYFVVAAYVFYAIHFILFLLISSKKYFYILLWIFIIALILNTVGCHMILTGVQNIQ